MNRSIGRRKVCRDGMSRLVIGGELALLLMDDSGTFLRSHYDLYAGFLYLFLRYGLLVLSSRQQRSLVEKVLKIGSGESHRALGDDAQVDVRSERFPS